MCGCVRRRYVYSSSDWTFFQREREGSVYIPNDGAVLVYFLSCVCGVCVCSSSSLLPRLWVVVDLNKFEIGKFAKFKKAFPS